MPEPVSWKEFLNDESQRKKLKQMARNKQWFNVRKRAKQCMEDLTLIMNSIKTVSAHPERQYALIFKDERTYSGIMEALSNAYLKSFKSTQKLSDPKEADSLQAACAELGITVHNRQWLSDRNNRWQMKKQLAKKKTADGRTGLEVFQALCVSKRHMEKLHQELDERLRALQSLVNCKKCGLEQKPTQWIPVVKCSRCGYQGEVIGNSYADTLWKLEKPSSDGQEKGEEKSRT